MKTGYPILIALFILAAWIVPGYARVSPESAKKYEEGQELFRKRRYQKALQAFTEAVKLDGKNAQAFRAMGRTYQELRNYNAAVEAYEKATGVKPEYAEAYYEQGQVQYYYQRKYGDAQESFQKVLEIDPGLDNGKVKEFLKAAYIKEGNLYFKQHNFKGAVAKFQDAVHVDSSDASVYYNLGLAYRYARMFDKAEEAFTTATEMDPDYAKAFKALGDLYKIVGKNSQAARSYSRAIDADSGYVDAYLNLAIVYVEIKQPEKALSVLKKASRMEPQNTEVLSALGYAYARQKDFPNTISTYKKALRLNGKDAEVHYRLAVAYYDSRKYPESIRAAKKAFGTSFDIPAHVIVGDTYRAFKPGNWQEKAIGHYQAGLQDRRYRQYCEDMIDRIKNPMGNVVQSDTGENR